MSDEIELCLHYSVGWWNHNPTRTVFHVREIVMPMPIKTCQVERWSGENGDTWKCQCDIDQPCPHVRRAFYFYKNQMDRKAKLLEQSKQIAAGPTDITRFGQRKIILDKKSN